MNFQDDQFPTDQWDVNCSLHPELVNVLYFEAAQKHPKLGRNSNQNNRIIQNVSSLQIFRNLFLYLVGGWTNPFEKYARQIGSFPQLKVNNKKYVETTN